MFHTLAVYSAFALGLLWSFAIAPAAKATGEAVAIGDVTQIFVDDIRISTEQGVVRRVHPCKKLSGPVVTPEYPWEGDRVYAFGSVDRNPETKQFRMWYASYPTGVDRDSRLTHHARALVLYATSADGLRWVKPKLGLYDFAGSRDNNIVYDVDSPSVIVDRMEADPERRYKMIGRGRHNDRAEGALVSYSADGLHWKDYPINPAFKTDDTITWTRDPYNRQYLAFHKGGVNIRGFGRRVVYLATSEDVQNWSVPTLILAPDEEDDAWATGPGEHTDFYNMSVFPYGGQFLGLVPAFRIERVLSETVPDQSPDDGPIEVQLVHSRDGRSWSRLDDRTPAIPTGPDAFDAGCILGVANTPIIHNDEIWIYYTAITTGHGGARPKKRITIGRAAWPIDRIVSLDAGDRGGSVETVPLRLTGDELVVNADASQGQLAVEVTDEQGNPLPAYTRAECVPLKADALHHVVRWKAAAHVKTDQAVRLRFVLRNAKLYSYRLR